MTSTKLSQNNTITPKRLRNFVFYLHRYLGLVLGLIIVVIGVTGTLWMFDAEVYRLILGKRLTQVTPQGQPLPLNVLVEKVQAAYSSQPDLKVSTISPDYFQTGTSPASVGIIDKNGISLDVLLNPYTGEILGTHQTTGDWLDIAGQLHIGSVAGHTGEIVYGIIGLLMFILCITGIFLWPGWRKLVTGFKIKLNTHPKRTNFDIHKVVGIFAAVFLAILGFTGFCMNWGSMVYPVIYAITFSPSPPEPTLVSVPIPGKKPISLQQAIQISNTPLPGATTPIIWPPTTPEGTYTFRKHFPEDLNSSGSSEVYVDQYSGKVLWVRSIRQISRGDKVIAWIGNLHFGHYGGRTTEIIYGVVGITPIILLITGFVMWWYRYQKKNKKQPVEFYNK
ncbi:PepSY-associated TM helix domain-containing protein [Nostoc sp.]|uniref:PepSY-associated TM helix domain-containing protein n=1 Tax=Nostoc sp. TaxID=1180 RepID=UPI002FFAE7FB